MAKIEVEVGRDLRAAAADVAEAWKIAEAGHAVAGSDRILFRDWSALCAVLTPKRYELLRHLRRAPETGIRPLARALGRDVKRVHDDVVALSELGLVARGEDGSLSSEIDAIISTICIAA
ncbi:hypothetical protein MKK84_28035 [Methylobacterium sp. E-065]|uniref:HVO_A0114 family putative DNA-binding protein n=1 Tax=Methylobacterium sp. E-065 TaxID=2836583 RepID=UPI001FBAA327|nr:hypothetical protein [Methylobacterium sp. E-065]MCJ2021221.1 hypothetical protein [Methylobacterium sp. E-065]